MTAKLGLDLSSASAENSTRLKNQHSSFRSSAFQPGRHIYMPKTSPTDDLSRRERQVMEILHRRGESTVAEIMAELPDPPTYSAVRSILRILSEKRVRISRRASASHMDCVIAERFEYAQRLDYFDNVAIPSAAHGELFAGTTMLARLPFTPLN